MIRGLIPNKAGVERVESVVFFGASPGIRFMDVIVAPFRNNNRKEAGRENIGRPCPETRDVKFESD